MKILIYTGPNPDAFHNRAFIMVTTDGPRIFKRYFVEPDIWSDAVEVEKTDFDKFVSERKLGRHLESIDLPI